MAFGMHVDVDSLKGVEQRVSALKKEAGAGAGGLHAGGSGSPMGFSHASGAQGSLFYAPRWLLPALGGAGAAGSLLTTGLQAGRFGSTVYATMSSLFGRGEGTVERPHPSLEGMSAAELAYRRSVSTVPPPLQVAIDSRLFSAHNFAQARTVRAPGSFIRRMFFIGEAARANSANTPGGPGRVQGGDWDELGEALQGNMSNAQPPGVRWGEHPDSPFRRFAGRRSSWSTQGLWQGGVYQGHYGGRGLRRGEVSISNYFKRQVGRSISLVEGPGLLESSWSTGAKWAGAAWAGGKQLLSNAAFAPGVMGGAATIMGAWYGYEQAKLTAGRTANITANLSLAELGADAGFQYEMGRQAGGTQSSVYSGSGFLSGYGALDLRGPGGPEMLSRLSSTMQGTKEMSVFRSSDAMSKMLAQFGQNMGRTYGIQTSAWGGGYWDAWKKRFFGGSNASRFDMSHGEFAAFLVEAKKKLQTGLNELSPAELQSTYEQFTGQKLDAQHTLFDLIGQHPAAVEKFAPYIAQRKIARSDFAALAAERGYMWRLNERVSRIRLQRRGQFWNRR